MVLLRTSEQRGEMVCSKSYHLSVSEVVNFLL